MRRVFLVTAVVLAMGRLSWWACERTNFTPLEPEARADSLVVQKAARALVLYADGRALKTYRIALGKQPLGHKQSEGDGRTPVGGYVIDWRNAHSTAYRSLHISYPNLTDSASAAARGVSPGGMVMIHGILNGFGFVGSAHRWRDWTNGCVAITNREMDELWRAVPNGTPIRIQP